MCDDPLRILKFIVEQHVVIKLAVSALLKQLAVHIQVSSQATLEVSKEIFSNINPYLFL